MLLLKMDNNNFTLKIRKRYIKRCFKMYSGSVMLSRSLIPVHHRNSSCTCILISSLTGMSLWMHWKISSVHFPISHYVPGKLNGLPVTHFSHLPCLMFLFLFYQDVLTKIGSIFILGRQHAGRIIKSESQKDRLDSEFTQSLK